MIIDRNVARYVVFAEDPILNALRKISDNKSGAVFSVTESGELEGVLTDGDFRRWLIDQREIDLNQPLSSISNKDFQALSQHARAEDIESRFNERIRFVLTREQLFEAFDRCRSRGLEPLCTPWDRESVEDLERYGMQAYKVASADLTNHDLLAALAKTGKPLLVSTGMSSEREIMDSI